MRLGIREETREKLLGWREIGEKKYLLLWKKCEVLSGLFFLSNKSLKLLNEEHQIIASQELGRRPVSSGGK